MRSAVTYKFFCAEILLHASTFTQTYFDTHWQVFYTQILLHGEFFRYRCFLTHAHTHAFSQGCLYPSMPLHRGIFTQRYFYAEIFLHGDAFTHTDTLLHTYTCTHQFCAKEFSKQVQNQNFTF